MNEYEIEHDVKLPRQRTVARRDSWSDLCVKMGISKNGYGDSIVLPDFKATNAMRSGIGHKGMKITVREQPDGTYRVWRLK